MSLNRTDNYRMKAIACEQQAGDASDRGGGERILHVVPARQRHRRERLMLVEPDDIGMGS